MVMYLPDNFVKRLDEIVQALFLNICYEFAQKSWWIFYRKLWQFCQPFKLKKQECNFLITFLLSISFLNLWSRWKSALKALGIVKALTI